LKTARFVITGQLLAFVLLAALCARDGAVFTTLMFLVLAVLSEIVYLLLGIQKALDMQHIIATANAIQVRK
jgi:hypothetical protein